MKHYQIYFLLLKALVLLQVFLVFIKKQTEDSIIYVLTDTLFKVSIALYLFLFFSLNSFPGLEFEDTLLLRFAGVILLYDINFEGLLIIIRKYIPSFGVTTFHKVNKAREQIRSTFAKGLK